MLFTLDRRHQRAMDTPVAALKNRACAELLLSVSGGQSVCGNRGRNKPRLHKVLGVVAEMTRDASCTDKLD